MDIWCHSLKAIFIHDGPNHKKIVAAKQTCKKIFFTPTWFDQKIFYPKKCVNYEKSNLQQNSVKGQKDQKSAKKCKKNYIRFQNVLKKVTTKREIGPLLT